VVVLSVAYLFERTIRHATYSLLNNIRSTMESRKAQFEKTFAAFPALWRKEFPLADSPEVTRVEELHGAPLRDNIPELYDVPYINLVGLDVVDKETSDESIAPIATPTRPTFFRRAEVQTIWDEIDKLSNSKAVFFQGQPGTGKSTAVWRKVFDNVLAGDNVLWVSLGRDGNPMQVVYFRGKFAVQLSLNQAMVEAFIAYCGHNAESFPLNTIVVDGMSQMDPAVKLKAAVMFWLSKAKPGRNRRAIFTASTKVERERDHQNDRVRYVIVHSWTEDDYCKALINGDKFTLIYESCSHLFHDSALEGQDLEEDSGSDSDDKEEGKDDEARTTRTDGMEMNVGPQAENTEPVTGDLMLIDPPAENTEQVSVDPMALSKEEQEDFRQTITTRFKYTGGSARWMFNYTKGSIDKKLKEYCHNVSNRTAVLNGDIGPTSSASSNFFFGSHKAADGATEYFLVSQRAVELLREQTDSTSFRTLYHYARRLQNPAFLGWVVEADFFEQLKRESEKGKCVSLRPTEQQFLPAERTIKFDHTKNRNRLATLGAAKTRAKTRNQVQAKVNRTAADLLPSTKGVSVACMPVLWNQGGYDVFFIEASNEKHVRIRFGQITKGESHSFKGGYPFAVIKFFETAGYIVDAVGFTFILTQENLHAFELSKVEGERFLRTYNMHGSKNKWDPSKLAECVGKCTMETSEIIV
jgi:hypothetical protein